MKNFKKNRLSLAVKWFMTHSTLSCATGLLVLGGAQTAIAQQEPEIEEVIVTGSFI